jgi:hypothetical protein
MIGQTQLIGSLVAILALAGIARMLRLGEGRINDEQAAMLAAEEQLVGFDAGTAILGGDGGAALVFGNGTVAVLKRHGAKIAARRLVPPLAIRPAIEGVTIETGEKLFGPVTLFGVVEDDVRRLEAALTRV